MICAVAAAVQYLNLNLYLLLLLRLQLRRLITLVRTGSSRTTLWLAKDAQQTFSPGRVAISPLLLLARSDCWGIDHVYGRRGFGS